VIRQMIAKSPDLHYQQPVEVAQALEALTVASAPPVLAKPAPPGGDRPAVTAIVEMGAQPSLAQPSVAYAPGSAQGPFSSQAPTVIHPKEHASLAAPEAEAGKSPTVPGTVASSAPVSPPADPEAAQKLRVVKGHRGW